MYVNIDLVLPVQNWHALSYLTLARIIILDTVQRDTGQLSLTTYIQDKQTFARFG